MKKYLTLLSLLMTTTIMFGQSNDSQCGSYFPLKKGTSWTMENFDKKGKLSSTSTTLVKDVSTTDSKSVFTLDITSENAEQKKDEEPYKQEIIYTCENGDLSVDMSSFLTPEAEASYAAMDITIEQENIVIPANLTKGQKLNDGNLKVNLASGMTLINIDVVNRVAQGKESVTTDAGTFDCMLVTYDVKSKIGFVNVSSSVKEWISPEVGIVKSENYNKKGKLMSSSKLKSFSK